MKVRLYSPLLALEAYLLITLVVFFFGPVSYRIHNIFLFLLYIFFYHICCCIGYHLGARLSIVNRKGTTIITKPVLSFGIVTSLAVISSLISNANLAMTSVFYPTNLIDLVRNGISIESIGLAYLDKVAAIDSYTGNKLLNVIFFFLAWPKAVYVPYLVYQWHNFKIHQKLVALIVALIPVLSGISTGTNKPVFDFVLLFISSLSVYFVRNKIKTGSFQLKSRRIFLIFSVSGLVMAVFFFSSAMQGRGVDYDFLESTSPLGDIKVKVVPSEEGVLAPGLVWLSTYLVQGYYGFSLALSQPFTTTYGVGNSPFLSRQFEWITGIDVRSRTYQYKISNYWGETEQWHSFYSQFANDFHFIGVGFILFFIGFLLATTWKAFIQYDSYYGMILLCLYFIMFVFMPANNQVFGFIESLSTFIIFNFLLFRSISLKT